MDGLFSRCPILKIGNRLPSFYLSKNWYRSCRSHLNTIFKYLFVLAALLVISSPSFMGSAAFGNIANSNSIKILTSVTAPSYANLVYDSGTHNVYAISTTNGNVYVLSSSTNKIVATLAGPSVPQTYLYNPSNHELYVLYCSNLTCSNPHSSYIAVIKGTQVVAKITYKYGFASPLVYDPANKEIFAQTGGPSQIQSNYCVYIGAVNSRTNSLVKTWNLACANLTYEDSAYISGIVFNPTSQVIIASACVSVPHNLLCNTYFINASNQTVGGNLCTPDTCLVPSSSLALYDPANNQLYIRNVWSDRDATYAVLAINSKDNAVSLFPTADNPDGSSNGLAYSPANSEVYCAGMCWNTGYGTPSYSIAINSKNQVVGKFSSSWSSVWYYKANKEILAETGTNMIALNAHNQKTATIQIPYNGTNPFLRIFDPKNNDAYIGNGTKLFVVTPSNTISNTFGIGCYSMLYDPSNADVYCSGIQRIFVVSS